MPKTQFIRKKKLRDHFSKNITYLKKKINAYVGLDNTYKPFYFISVKLLIFSKLRRNYVLKLVIYSNLKTSQGTSIIFVI